MTFRANFICLKNCMAEKKWSRNYEPLSNEVTTGSAETRPGIGIFGDWQNVIGERNVRAARIRRGAFLLAGRFEPLRRNIPYASLIDAFQEMIRQILAENQEGLERWRDRLTISAWNQCFRHY